MEFYKKLRLNLVLALVFVNCISCYASSSNWYKYDPVIVKLSGVVVAQVAYGAPSYGEDPKHDVKFNVYMLKLDKPINVKGDPKSELDTSDFRNVSKIQMDTEDYMEKYVNKKVVVTGTLYQRNAGLNAYTDVMMTVNEMHEVKP